MSVGVLADYKLRDLRASHTRGKMWFSLKVKIGGGKKNQNMQMRDVYSYKRWTQWALLVTLCDPSMHKRCFLLQRWPQWALSCPLSIQSCTQIKHALRGANWWCSQCCCMRHLPRRNIGQRASRMASIFIIATCIAGPRKPSLQPRRRWAGIISVKLQHCCWMRPTSCSAGQATEGMRWARVVSSRAAWPYQSWWTMQSRFIMRQAVSF